MPSARQGVGKGNRDETEYGGERVMNIASIRDFPASIIASAYSSPLAH